MEFLQKIFLELRVLNLIVLPWVLSLFLVIQSLPDGVIFVVHFSSWPQKIGAQNDSNCSCPSYFCKKQSFPSSVEKNSFRVVKWHVSNGAAAKNSEKIISLPGRYGENLAEFRLADLEIFQKMQAFQNFNC